MQEHDMPMRGELVIPAPRPEISETTDHDAWAVVGFCLASLLISICCMVGSVPLGQISLLIVQSNLW
jgi:hypothetical protein